MPLGVVVALPALRLQGLYLALVTFGFARCRRDLVFQDPHSTARAGQRRPARACSASPSPATRPSSCSAPPCSPSSAIGVLALRRGAFGRRLAAMRDSQAACATLGLDVRRTKLAVFCLSSAIAGLAGALFGGLSRPASADISFEPVNNIVLFLFAFVGGITTITGAFLGGLLFAVLPLVQSE